MLNKKIINILLILSFSLLSNCTNDNNVTSSPNIEQLTKPYSTKNIHNTETSDFEKWINAFRRITGISSSALAFSVALNPGLVEYICFFAYLIGLEEIFIDNEESSSIIGSEKELYNFRDNFLDKTAKGQSYIASYYVLSKFGIENNLVNKYYKEHHELLKNSVNIAFELQYGTSNDKILIKNEIAEKLEDMLKIYRNHENHRDIDPVLDYLEIELNKYQNKPKSEISASFN